MASLLSPIYSKLPPRLRYYITQTRQVLRRLISDRRAIAEAKHLNQLSSQRLSKMTHLRVLFLVVYDSMWKFDTLYRRMQEDDRFTPIMLIVPAANLSDRASTELENRTYQSMMNKGFTPIKAKTDTGLLEPQSLSPDIVFITTPYDIQVDPIYRYHALRSLPVCHARYGYPLEAYSDWYDLLIYNCLWTFYLSSKDDWSYFCQLSRQKGINGYISGTPIFDAFLDEEERRINSPQISDCPLIIIAPHHSIEAWGYSLSNFMNYHQLFQTIALEYEGRLRFAFKPHPVLRTKLSVHPDWGIERTDAYYDFWNAPDKGRTLVQGDYIQLFYDSSAMIHDCSAFMVEYIFTLRPALYLIKDKSVVKDKVEIAQKAFDLHDKATNEFEIRQFVQRIACGEPDTKLDERKQFREQYLLPPNQSRAADRIIDHLASFLAPQKS